MDWINASKQAAIVSDLLPRFSRHEQQSGLLG
jgi:hypothetical protein